MKYIFLLLRLKNRHVLYRIYNICILCGVLYRSYTLQHIYMHTHSWYTSSFFQIGLLRCEFVPLWACRVQHLRPYYCGVKPKQRGKAVISCHVWYLPLLMMSWLTALTCFINISLHQQHLLETREYSYRVLASPPPPPPPPPPTPPLDPQDKDI